MKAVVIRALSASVEIGRSIDNEIGIGFLVLLGIKNGDTEKEAIKLAEKSASYEYLAIWTGK